MNRIERESCFYHDESGERFRQLVQDAEQKRAAFISGFKQTIFWTAVIFVGAAFIYFSGMYYGGQ